MSGEALSTLVLLGSFFVFIILRFPIAYSVGLSTVLCMISMGQNIVTLPQQMVKGIWSFSLMAVPFFITMGVLMGTGGISDKLVVGDELRGLRDLFRDLVGADIQVRIVLGEGADTEQTVQGTSQLVAMVMAGLCETER
ncbi:MAG: TRAP transporter large permease subunit [Clostridia bacterium]|nr:TRAP transporter large permease subunit [Clostridia bacterium]